MNKTELPIGEASVPGQPQTRSNLEQRFNPLAAMIFVGTSGTQNVGNRQISLVPFGRLHLLVIVLCVATIGGVVIVGRSLPEIAEWRFRIGVAVFGIALWLVHQAYWNWRGIDWARGLPLHFCDLAGVVGPIALLTSDVWMRSLLYFWGFSFAVVAFVQPTVTRGATRARFGLFWSSHLLIVVCAAYDVAVIGFRPDWADLFRAAIVSVCTVAVLVPFNVIMQANYGYVGQSGTGAGAPPMLDLLGTSPKRILVMAALAALSFLLLLSVAKLATS